jgi:hypothetical protein
MSRKPRHVSSKWICTSIQKELTLKSRPNWFRKEKEHRVRSTILRTNSRQSLPRDTLDLGHQDSDAPETGSWFRTFYNYEVVSKGPSPGIQLLVRNRLCACDEFDFLALTMSAVEFGYEHLGVRLERFDRADHECTFLNRDHRMIIRCQTSFFPSQSRICYQERNTESIQAC